MFNQGTNKINKLKSFGIGKHDFQVGQVQQYEEKSTTILENNLEREIKTSQ